MFSSYFNYFFLESEHDTDKEMEEWENQQIRKGVTGAQVGREYTQRITIKIKNEINYS